MLYDRTYNSLSVRWTQSSFNGGDTVLSSHNLYIKAVDDSLTPPVEVSVTNFGCSEYEANYCYTFTLLNKGTTYVVAVSAVNTQGSSSITSWSDAMKTKDGRVHHYSRLNFP